MPTSRAEFFRRLRRWTIPAVLLALMPKCFLCFVGYAGLGTALGLGGPEICGASSDMTYTHALALLLSGLSLGLLGLYIRHWRSRSNTTSTQCGAARPPPSSRDQSSSGRIC